MPTAVRRHRFVIAAALVVPTLVFAAAAWGNREEVLREGTDAVVRTAAVMEEHAAKVFDTADLILARVADRLRTLTPDQVAARETSAFLHDVKAPFDQFVSLWVADADGRVVAGSQSWDRASAATIAERDFFRAHREDADGGAYVSAAFTGRATTTPSFAISRRRPDPEGRFVGTIHVALSPDYFARFYAEAGPPFRYVAGLVRSDGARLVRQPALPVEPSPLSPGSPLLRRIAAGEGRGTFTDLSPSEGVNRLYAFRRVGNWPVHVVLAADAEAIAARWRENLRLYGAVAAVAALTLLFVAWLALRRARAAEVAEAALRREVAARAAAEARQAAEARFRGVFESRIVGMAVFDHGTGEILLVNDRLLEMTGSDRARYEASGWDWRAVTPPEYLPADERAIAQARERGWWDPFEKEYLRPDGTRLPVRVASAPLPGEPGRVVVQVQDISEQREAEGRRDILMREVDHRAKNALATARAALRLTRAPSLDDFVREVDGRIGALAQALTLLSTTQWQGVDLEALIRGELSPFLTGKPSGPRTALDGPAVSIAATAVQPLAMTIHELATNATKYGALSRDGGVLTVTWRVVSGDLHLRWEERGGPAVAARPTVAGFGTRVIENTVSRQLRGRVTMNWDPPGLSCEMVLPADRVIAAHRTAEVA